MFEPEDYLLSNSMITVLVVSIGAITIEKFQKYYELITSFHSPKISELTSVHDNLRMYNKTYKIIFFILLKTLEYLASTGQLRFRFIRSLSGVENFQDLFYSWKIVGVSSFTVF
jgi:hypothetical protein